MKLTSSSASNTFGAWLDQGWHSNITYSELLSSSCLLPDYAAPVWSPYHKVHINRIEGIQKKILLSFLGRQWLPGSYALLPYKVRIAACNLDTIASRHNAANVMLVYDNLMGRARCPGIRGKIQLNPNHRGRRSKYLAGLFHRTDYGQNEPINKCITKFNSVAHVFLTGVSRRGFRAALREL